MQDRVKSFDNVLNFRDFGGYPTTDGRRLRTQTLFRSAQFGEASDADLVALDQYGIKVQADLRRPDERESQGKRWQAEGVTVYVSNLGTETEAPHERFLTQVTVNQEQARGWMLDFYRDAPFKPEHVETFANWFKALADLPEGDAALVNCAAGKDRTGILCALTHYSLGVDRDSMFADYELSNQAFQVEERLPEIAAMLNERIGRTYAPEVFQPFIGVHADFLANALASIEAKAGSVDSYLADTLGVGAAQIEHLRSKFLV